MRSIHRPLLALMVGLVTLTSCDETSVTTPPPPTAVPLIPGVWYLHSADGEDLPALISDRIVGVAQEETFLDSARIVVSSTGVYEQRYWLRVLVTGNLDRQETVIDLGTWVTSGGQHNFQSTVRDREFTFFTPQVGHVTSTEKFATFLAAPENQGEYRLFPP